jgi:hypothetical protein
MQIQYNLDTDLTYKVCNTPMFWKPRESIVSTIVELCFVTTKTKGIVFDEYNIPIPESFSFIDI